MAYSPSPGSGIGRGLMIQSASPQEVTEAENKKARSRAAAMQPIEDDMVLGSLSGHIRQQWDMMRMHRTSNAGWNERMLHAMRVFNREYDGTTLAEIQQFGGSDIYSGLTATKCRGATALLREVYLNTDRPWGLDPTPEPTLPEGIVQAIQTLVGAEMQGIQQSGQPIDPASIQDRINGLVEHALRASKKKAQEEADKAEDAVDDYLVEGGFYTALADFLVDLPIFPFACIKGPVVRVVEVVKWQSTPEGTKAAMPTRVAKMFWNRVSPFDVYFTPGVSDIRDADVIEVCRYSRSDLNALIGVPGYRDEMIRNVLRDYGRTGHYEYMDTTDSERAINENRESPIRNESLLIDCLEYHGNVQGSMLLEWGLDEDEIPDPDLDYFVQAWQIGRYTIKVQLHPSPRKRAPYFITSFEKVPGTPVGNALPDMLKDLQDTCNSTLRALVNNLSLSSGPQVVVNDDRIAPGGDNDDLFPWKRWHVVSDPFSAGSAALPPVSFFQPQSNANDLLMVYEKFSQMADEQSAIPRYITGSDRMGGAGRTASGLAMLMGNANKLLQNVAGNIDRDVMNDAIQALYDMLMMTDKNGLFRGDETIRVRGVEVAVQRETNRQRQMELLQATNNPTDQAIMGPMGRAALLRSVSNEVGLPGEDIVPTEDELKAKLEQEAQQQQAQNQAQMEAQAQALAAKEAGKGDRDRIGPGAPGVPAIGPPGAGTAPAPANTDLGVPEGNAMRGMV